MKKSIFTAFFFISVIIFPADVFIEISDNQSYEIPIYIANASNDVTFEVVSCPELVSDLRTVISGDLLNISFDTGCGVRNGSIKGIISDGSGISKILKINLMAKDSVSFEATELAFENGTVNIEWTEYPGA